jgi:hypothetical protein
MIEEHPFALRHQYQLLSRLTCPMLKLINHKLGYVSSGNKLVLINQIVNHYFLAIIPNARINPLVPRPIPSIQLRSSVLDGFLSLQMWSTRNEAEPSYGLICITEMCSMKAILRPYETTSTIQLILCVEQVKN